MQRDCSPYRVRIDAVFGEGAKCMIMIQQKWWDFAPVVGGAGRCAPTAIKTKQIKGAQKGQTHSSLPLICKPAPATFEAWPQHVAKM